jgi:hypothetical protein
MKTLKTSIDHDGQPFYDEPVYREVSRANPLALALSRALPGCRKVQEVIQELSHHERVWLRWMRPDGKGGLVPRG